MLDLLWLGSGVVLAPAAHLVLVRVRSGRWREPPLPGEQLPPPAGHLAVLSVAERALACPCGWRWSLPWPATSRRVNRARAGHYAAVEQQRMARRLGVDAEAVLDRVVAAQQADQWPDQRPDRLALQAPPAVEPARHLEVVTGWTQPRAPRRSPRAVQARRASAVARVEAARVLPRYTSGEE